MTRNTITKARVIYAYTKDEQLPVTGRVSKALATQGIDYTITLSWTHLYISADCADIRFTSISNQCTHFHDYYDAKRQLNEHKTAIKKAEKRHRECSYMPSNESINITAKFNVYYDTVTKEFVYNKEATKKWGKNLVFITLGEHSRPVDPSPNLLWFTLSAEENSLLFETYNLRFENSIPHFIPNQTFQSFRVYKDHRVFKVFYDEKGRCYKDVEHGQLYADSFYFESNDYYDSSRGMTRAFDLTGGCAQTKKYLFNEATRKILKDFGVSDYTYTGSRPTTMQDMKAFINDVIDFEKPFVPGATKICQEISCFLKDIPFDEEHTIVKYKNGYIMRFGKIEQIYKFEYTTKPRYGEQSGLRSYRYRNDDCTETIVREDYVEYARLFVSNTLSTRSLSMKDGKRWKPEHIQHIESLFVSNPEETNLKINVEEMNRQTLKKLYTVHPKLKYMTKYIEKHPSILYESDVAFLRGLFQYDMILETIIALGKDDMFWRRSEDGKRETFHMEGFIDCMSLRLIDQKGDFYQRLGLTKQQFKLLLEKPKELHHLMEIINHIYYTLPNSTERIRVIHYGSSKDSREKLKLVSYEDFRLSVEIIRKLLSRGYSYTTGYAMDINDLLAYYGSFKRVHKVVCEKEYNIRTLKDYLQMRNKLKVDEFPDYKESVWDMFPDDDTDLVRYHDRIMLLVSENKALNDIYCCYNFRCESKEAIYKALKQINISCSEFYSIMAILNKACALSGGTLSKYEIMSGVPKTAEEYEQKKQQINVLSAKYFSLYSIYYGDAARYDSLSDCDRLRAKIAWGNEYNDFVRKELETDLNFNKYDLYLRARRKIISNKPDFDVSKYPMKIENNELLTRLYAEISKEEVEVNELIRRREEERRAKFIREQEGKIAAQNAKYAERYKKLKRLAFSPKDDERCIVVPQNLVTLVIEGQTLHHCVGSYVDAVAEGKNTIVFLRKTNDTEAPYVTISLMPDGKMWYIDQAHGDHNSDISDEDVKFLKSWAEAKGILSVSIKQHYGMYCHR